MAYEVHLDVYDGPFDLLLQLITAQQVDLYEVRLSDIVDAFLGELARLESLDLELATEFLLIAATLIELKCRRLLPGSGDIDLDEDLSLFEARDYLLARLLECRTFSQAAAALATLEQAASLSHGRRAGPEEEFLSLEPDLLAGVTPERLAAAAAKALAPRQVTVISISHVHEDEVSVGETMERLIERLPGLGPTTLRDLLEPGATTAAFVACFLALLELYKSELVELEQLATFGELQVNWTGGVPSASAVIAEYVRAEYDGEDGEDGDGHEDDLDQDRDAAGAFDEGYLVDDTATDELDGEGRRAESAAGARAAEPLEHVAPGEGWR